MIFIQRLSLFKKQLKFAIIIMVLLCLCAQKEKPQVINNVQKQTPTTDTSHIYTPSIPIDDIPKQLPISDIIPGTSRSINNSDTLYNMLNLLTNKEGFHLPETLYINGTVEFSECITIENVRGLVIAGTKNAVFLNHCAGDACIAIVNCASVVISDILFKNGTEDECTSSMIKISNSLNITVADCDLNGCATNGITICDGSNNIAIKNNSIRNDADIGISSDVPSVNITNNTFTHCKEADILFDGIEYYWIKNQVLNISENTFDKSGGGIMSVSNGIRRNWKPSYRYSRISIDDSLKNKIAAYENGQCYLQSNDSLTEYNLEDEHNFNEAENPIFADFFNNPEKVDVLSCDAAEDSELYELWRIGIIRTGEYEGGILYNVISSGSDKSGISDIRVGRYIRFKNILIYLPRNSSGCELLPPFSYHMDEDGEQAFKDIINFKLYNGVKKVVTNLEFIPELIMDTLISLPPTNQELALLRTVNIGQVDTSFLEIAGYKQSLLPIYITRTLLPIQSDNDYASSAFHCNTPDCLKMGGYYVLLPDGTLNIYGPQLDFNPQFSNNTKPDSFEQGCEYYPYTSLDCEGHGTDFLSVVSNDDIDVQKDLTLIGALKNGDSIYGLKNSNHKYYKNCYNELKSNWKEYYQHNADAKPLCSFSTFSTTNPWFYWKDPVGRYIKVIHRSYLPPSNCEPMIYLYSEINDTVTVTLGEKIKPIKSKPAYTNKWIVRTSADGQMEDIRDNTIHNRLFWEGVSDYLPQRSSGYVIARDEIPSFLSKKLTELGLNNKETSDFIEAWQDDLQKSPYCFITFYDKETIDAYAPITISPPPQTVIRVLMDYENLDQPKTVNEPFLKKPPERKGLTFVEWGGLKQAGHY